MSWKIGMPNLGHTMEAGKVAEWLKAVGAAVVKGDVIAVVETDKANFDVESPADGTLLAIDVPAGTVVTVGTIIGLVGAPGETPPTTTPPPAPTTANSAAAVTAAAPRRARFPATPAARSLASELGIDLASVAGTGDGGIITRDDVRAHGPAAGATPPPAASMRRAIAEATERSWRTIPHVTLVRRADVTGLVADKRHRMTASVVRAAALALARHRGFNGWLMDGIFRECASPNVAVAVATGQGLLMPVVRAADTKSVAAIASEIEALAAAARSGALAGSQTIDASFSVSSLGRWGVEVFTPIISAPQVAILGVGAVDRVAREAPDGAVRFRSELALCLVFDHRANDGAEAAEFLADIAGHLENLQ